MAATSQTTLELLLRVKEQGAEAIVRARKAVEQLESWHARELTRARRLVDYGYLSHMVEKDVEVEKDVDARERYANFVMPTLVAPFEVWATRYDDGAIRPRLIGLFKGARQLAVILRMNRDGSLFFNMMNPDDRRLDNFRVGSLLHGK